MGWCFFVILKKYSKWLHSADISAIIEREYRKQRRSLAIDTKRKSKKSLGKLINIMILDFLMKYPEGLSEAEIINKIIEEYGLEEASYEERLKKEIDLTKEVSLKSGSDLRQTVRGQVRRALAALCNIGDYLDLEKEGVTGAVTFWKQYGVKVVDERQTDQIQHGKFYKLRSAENAANKYKLSDEELRTLMFHIRSNQFVNGAQTSGILEKLWQQGSYHFRKEIKSTFIGEDFLPVKDTDWDKEFIAEDYVMENVSLLLKVIQENTKKEKSRIEKPELAVEFEFYAYDEHLQLRPSEEILGKTRKRRVVTPLKVLQDDGRFYVYVAAENYRKEKEKPWTFWTYRVDLMCDMKIKKGENVYIPSEEQKQELRFGNIKKYLNMSFSSETEEIRFLFLRERITAIADGFGRKKANVKILRFHEEERKKGKAVVKLKEGEREVSVFSKEGKEWVFCKVNCTEFGFVNWVMQYLEYALVLEPQSVVDKIEEKIKGYDLHKRCT